MGTSGMRNGREEEEVRCCGSPNRRFLGRRELTFLFKSTGKDLDGSWSNAKEISFFFFWRGGSFLLSFFSLVFLGTGGLIQGGATNL